MTKEELVKLTAEKSGITIEETTKIIDAFTEEIKSQLIAGEKVTISGFGTFVLSKRGPKTFVNPKNGQKFDLPERHLPHFKASGDLKRAVQK